MSVCINHPDTEAVARCAACGKPICEACIVPGNGKDYCSEECRSRGLAAAARSSDVISRGAKADHAAAIRKIVWTVILLAVIAAGAWYYMSHKDEINAKANQIEKKVKAAGDEAVQKTKQGIPGDSKYKREREKLVE